MSKRLVGIKKVNHKYRESKEPIIREGKRDRNEPYLFL